MCLLPAAALLRASAQDAANSEKKIPIENVPATTKASTENDDLVVLSPFTVSTEKDKGYFGENTLAGSRMKTKLSDLGSSISIVTKAQMTDFASHDINDVFRYEVNTEGSSTYTPTALAQKSDGILDVNAGGTSGSNVVSLTNSTANRIRGLGVPGFATNYYLSIANVPPDAYNTQSFEISRGPNSMLFGVGQPAGIVNQSTMQASVTKNLNRVEVSVDDRGSFRTSLSINRVLIPNKLAIYGALLWDDKKFERKPSYDNTRRQYVALTYKPFAKTTLSANFENYSNKNRRPNTISPIDYVTQWNLAGRPTYDALTKKVTLLSTGQVIGPYYSADAATAANTSYAQSVRDYIRSRPDYNPALRGTNATTFTGTDQNFSFYNGITIFGQGALNPALSLTTQNPYASALYVPGMVEYNQSRTVMQIGDGQLQNWFQPLYLQSYRTGWNNPVGGTEHTFPIDNFTSALTTSSKAALWANSTSVDMYNRDNFSSGGWTNNTWVTNVGNYKYAGVTDRSIYDWKKVNINAMNFGEQKNRNYNVELQQEITKELFLSAGWFRQDFEQRTNYTVAQQFATAIKIDENKYLSNGSLNPYFGLPFVNDQDPDRYINAQIDDHFRGMLAYTPDFTKKEGWLKWLGHHQILGAWSRDESMALARRMRLAYTAAATDAAKYRYMANNQNNNPDGTRSGWSFFPTSNATMIRNFYLASPGDPMGKVTQASGEWNPLTYTGNIQVFNYATGSFEDANVTESFVTFDSPTRTQQILNSLSAGMTNYFWQDRLVTTFGARLDKHKARATTTGSFTLPDGTKTAVLTGVDKFTPDGYFNDSSIWNRFNPWTRTTGRTKTGGGVFRPFSGWTSIDNRANGDNQFWQIVQNFGISYNWSNNFNVPSGAQNDAFGKALPNPSGVGHDIGFQFTALNGKLFARVTWFEASNENQRLNAGTAISRLTTNIDTTLFRNWARTIALINMGQDPTQASFGQNIIAGSTQDLALQAAIAPIWQQDYNYYTNLPGTITATGDSVAKGTEVQINYNTGNWRNRFTFGKQDTVNSNMLKQFDAWYATRNPIWQAAKASDFLLPQYKHYATDVADDGISNYRNSGGTYINIANFWTGYGWDSSAKLTNTDGTTSVANTYASVVVPQSSLARDLDGQSAPDQRKYHWAYNTGYDFTTRMLKGFGIGGAERWDSKSVIGYYGKAIRTTTNVNLLDASDVSRPIYDKANYYTDLFARYQRKIWSNRIAWTLQLNVENVFEKGHLQTVAVNYDGSPYGYRIIDSRKFTLTSTFEF